MISAPYMHDGFPFVIPNGNTWDGSYSPASFSLSDAVIAPWSLTGGGEFWVNCSQVNADGTIPVGPGTAYNVAVTMDQAMRIYWRIRSWTLSLNLTMSRPLATPPDYSETYALPDIEIQMGGSVGSPTSDTAWPDPANSYLDSELQLVVPVSQSGQSGQTSLQWGPIASSSDASGAFLMSFAFTNSTFARDSSGQLWWAPLSISTYNDYPVFPVFYGAPGICYFCLDGDGYNSTYGQNYLDPSQYGAYSSGSIGTATIMGLSADLQAYQLPDSGSGLIGGASDGSLTFNAFTLAPKTFWGYGGKYDTGTGDYTG
jgi:hypothetical protein